MARGLSCRCISRGWFGTITLFHTSTCSFSNWGVRPVVGMGSSAASAWASAAASPGCSADWVQANSNASRNGAVDPLIFMGWLPGLWGA